MIEFEEEQKIEEFIKSLPPLTGTDKQVEWATQIRETMVRNYLRESYYRIRNDDFELQLMRMSDYKDVDIDYDIEKAMEFFPLKTAASFWIESRHYNTNYFADLISNTLYNDEVADPELVKAVQDEVTVYPEDQQTKVIATIKWDKVNNCIKVYSPKDEIVIDILKSYGYKWDGVWFLNLIKIAKDAPDRMAEIGNALLCHGVPIIIYDESIRQKAISGEFKDRCLRWIKRHDDTHVAIWWKRPPWKKRHTDDIWDEAKSLPHAKWGDSVMIVEAKYYTDIYDFADINHFGISDNARLVLKAAADKEANIKPVAVKKHVPAEEGDKLKDILNSSRDILDDLRED